MDAAPSHLDHGDCANCGTALRGPFCSSCGQSAETLKRPAWELIEHALESFFHFDARGPRTVVLLLFHPGRLTTLYLAGKRVAFVPPVRLYIVVSLAFFLAIWATDTAIVQFPGVPRPNGADAFSVKLFAPLDLSHHATPKAFGENLQLEVNDAVPGWFARIVAGAERAFADLRMLNERLSDLFPKMMFGLVPLFAIVLWLLYARRRRFLIEHRIFALHFHSFAFLLATAVILARPILPAGWAGIAFFAPAAAYLLLAMKQAYGQGWVKTTLKEGLLLVIYGAGFIAGMIGLVAAGLSEI